ncbi:heme ABC transporter ATP-binding protein [Stigmatella aurantiaca]|uniref:Hemin ABC transporter, ATP-binding protein HutD n=1 Tax=Stigmatella aurantiaca (strain DW4/3-1) TaxID=378806 RepID=Q09A78_STIAD|nr:heme ABC transporter ATP-binding protein [Stigmatella aurantiaca]ADO75070.1 Hemin ABC transporter, ATP-binding protein HutD [Stigmatella aurantiaca DW4/3-1]EAU68627.1 hemin ABC transporter, ATP-binding protein HutD [Stigmatella aurantiaca DW4/3-1]
MSLSAREVDVLRGRQRILSQVSLEVRPGELLAVVGPNGAGKSTLLGALAGELRCTAGEILFEGLPLSRWKPLARARQLGVLPQDSTLSFGFTALEVVLLGRTPHGSERGGKEDTRIALAALEATGTQHLASRTYPTLSGGERQRVQLARVLAQLWEAPSNGHRYLLLDEPTSSLDLSHQHLVLELAARFAQQGGAVLAILHDLNLAARYAHRVAVLAEGHVVALGAPAQVLQPDLIERVFGIHVKVLEHTGSPVPLIVPWGRAPQAAPEAVPGKG